jgi:NADH pyrophosphatase NudC (nudix superfamily)
LTSLEHAERSIRCPSCGLEVYANPAPTVSAVVRDDRGRILLARRAFDPGAGLWDLLGGFMDEGEEPLETLRRELLEETGLTVEPGEYLGGIPADDVAELAWFPADALPPRSEFAFANTVELLDRIGATFT